MKISTMIDHALRLSNDTHHMKLIGEVMPRTGAAAVRACLPDAGPALSWQKQERTIPSILNADHT